jgi:hypothetical protein
MKYLYILALLLFLPSVYAQSLILHGPTKHGYPTYYAENFVEKKKFNSVTFGVGYKFDNNWVTGVYYNSYYKPTLYAGRMFMWDLDYQIDNRPIQIGFALVGATGYKSRTNMVITPLVTANLSVPIDKKYSLEFLALPAYKDYPNGARTWSAAVQMGISYKF